MNNKKLGLLVILFPIAVQIPFAILTSTFGYPDILREDPGTVLTRFYSLGSPLVWTWYAYAISIFIFLAANFELYQVVPKNRANYLFGLGLASGFIQLVALLRWVFLVPILARLYNQAESATTKEILRAIFEIQNSFIGVGLGEHVGQATMAAWSVCLSLSLAFKFKKLRQLGFTSALLLIVGLSEHLCTAFGIVVPHLDKFAAIGFVLWSIWLIGIGLQILKMEKLSGLFQGEKT